MNLKTEGFRAAARRRRTAARAVTMHLPEETWVRLQQDAAQRHQSAGSMAALYIEALYRRELDGRDHAQTQAEHKEDAPEDNLLQRLKTPLTENERDDLKLRHMKTEPNKNNLPLKYVDECVKQKYTVPFGANLFFKSKNETVKCHRFGPYDDYVSPILIELHTVGGDSSCLQFKGSVEDAERLVYELVYANSDETVRRLGFA